MLLLPESVRSVPAAATDGERSVTGRACVGAVDDTAPLSAGAVLPGRHVNS